MTKTAQRRYKEPFEDFQYYLKWWVICMGIYGLMKNFGSLEKNGYFGNNALGPYLGTAVLFILSFGNAILSAILFTLLQNVFNKRRIKIISWLLAIILLFGLSAVFVLFGQYWIEHYKNGNSLILSESVIFFFVFLTAFWIKWTYPCMQSETKSELMTASSQGDSSKVTSLIDAGVNINQKSKSGYTALMYAALNNHLTVVSQLLEHGANPNISSRNQTTAVLLAEKRGYKEIINTINKFIIISKSKEKVDFFDNISQSKEPIESNASENPRSTNNQDTTFFPNPVSSKISEAQEISNHKSLQPKKNINNESSLINPNKKTNLLILTSIAIVALFFVSLIFSRKFDVDESYFGILGNYDDCVLDNIKGVSDRFAVNAVENACMQKYPKKFNFEKIAKISNTSSWPEILAAGQYDKLDSDSREQAKKSYFEKVIKPNVHPDFGEEARAQFNIYVVGLEHSHKFQAEKAP